MTERYRLAAVTGAAGGIGAAITRRLVAGGLEVLAVGRRAEPLEALAVALGPAVTPLALDVADATAVEAALRPHPVDVLIANAGLVTRGGPVWEQTPEDVRALLDVNIGGVVHPLRALVPGMLERDRGHIVCIGSAAGHYALDGMPLYGATKAALASLCQTLRLDLVASRIRVAEIYPGRVETGIHAAAVGGDAARAEALFYRNYASLLPEDLAEAVAFVLAAPARVDVNVMELMPTHQANGGSRFHPTGRAPAAPRLFG